MGSGLVGSELGCFCFFGESASFRRRAKCDCGSPAEAAVGLSLQPSPPGPPGVHLRDGGAQPAQDSAVRAPTHPSLFTLPVPLPRGGCPSPVPPSGSFRSPCLLLLPDPWFILPKSRRLRLQQPAGDVTGALPCLSLLPDSRTAVPSPSHPGSPRGPKKDGCPSPPRSRSTLELF